MKTITVDRETGSIIHQPDNGLKIVLNREASVNYEVVFSHNRTTIVDGEQSRLVDINIDGAVSNNVGNTMTFPVSAADISNVGTLLLAAADAIGKQAFTFGLGSDDSDYMWELEQTEYNTPPILPAFKLTLVSACSDVTYEARYDGGTNRRVTFSMRMPSNEVKWATLDYRDVAVLARMVKMAALHAKEYSKRSYHELSCD